MSIEVIVPWRAGCAHRERALRWATRRYRGLTLTVAEYDGDPWVKAMAVNPAVQRSSASVLVIADADVWSAGTAGAIEAVASGDVQWAVPHTGVFRLTPDATETVLRGAHPHRGMETIERPYRGIIGGGIVVAARETLQRVPLDPRFAGWGQEDVSWGNALTTLAGHPWRGRAPLFHLWHPPAERADRRYGNENGKRLARRYATAMHDPDAMTALLLEAASAHRPADAPLHHHAAHA